MIVSSFYEKAELEQFLKHEIETRDYADCIEACWSALLQARLSVVLKTGKNYDPKSNLQLHKLMYYKYGLFDGSHF